MYVCLYENDEVTVLIFVSSLLWISSMNVGTG